MATNPVDEATEINIVRRHYFHLAQVLALFPDVLLSLSNGFYQHSFIDLNTKSSINRSGGLPGASMLLDHVMMKIEQSDQYLPLVMDILREEVALKDIVQKMEKGDSNDQTMNDNPPEITHGEDISMTTFLSHNDVASMNVLYEDMMCFKISYIPINIQTGCSSVPSWCDVKLSTSATSPCTRILYSYTAYKKTNSIWSQPFYSTDNGYKLQLNVNANGDGSGKGTHLSLYVYLMKGDYDDTLSWPFNANITVQLLNCSSDSHHVEWIIPHHTPPLECRQRVVDGDTAPGGLGCDFISHTKLQDTSDHTVTFINTDNICLRIISVDII